MTDAELVAIAFAANTEGTVTIDGATLYLLTRELIANRKALRECGEKIADRDAKIIELREIIHQGTTTPGGDHEPKSATRKSRPRKPFRPS